MIMVIFFIWFFFIFEKQHYPAYDWKHLQESLQMQSEMHKPDNINAITNIQCLDKSVGWWHIKQTHNAVGV